MFVYIQLLATNVHQCSPKTTNGVICFEVLCVVRSARINSASLDAPRQSPRFASSSPQLASRLPRSSSASLAGIIFSHLRGLQITATRFLGSLSNLVICKMHCTRQDRISFALYRISSRYRARTRSSI